MVNASYYISLTSLFTTKWRTWEAHGMCEFLCDDGVYGWDDLRGTSLDLFIAFNGCLMGEILLDYYNQA